MLRGGELLMFEKSCQHPYQTQQNPDISQGGGGVRHCAALGAQRTLLAGGGGGAIF
jgi:hypothetical protein